MRGWLLLAVAGATAAQAADDPIATDRMQFEQFWQESQKEAAAAGMSKELTWAFYEWSQAQFSLGFCSKFIRADDMERMRRIPDEDMLMKSALGRMFLSQSSESFREGMAFRSQVTPTVKLCEDELAQRGKVLETMPKAPTK